MEFYVAITPHGNDYVLTTIYSHYILWGKKQPKESEGISYTQFLKATKIFTVLSLEGGIKDKSFSLSPPPVPPLPSPPSTSLLSPFLLPFCVFQTFTTNVVILQETCYQRFPARTYPLYMKKNRCSLILIARHLFGISRSECKLDVHI